MFLACRSEFQQSSACKQSVRADTDAIAQINTSLGLYNVDCKKTKKLHVIITINLDKRMFKSKKIKMIELEPSRWLKGKHAKTTDGEKSL